MNRFKKDHVKVLSILSLSASDARNDTLTSIILNTIYERECILKNELCEAIQQLYEFEPYMEEVNALLNGLIEMGKVLVSQNNHEEFCLSDTERKNLQQAEILLKDQDKLRYQNFKTFITDELEAGLDSVKIKLLWEVFREYLYNNFFEYGEDALKRFHPYIKSAEDEVRNEDFLQLAFKRLSDPQLTSIFRQTIDKFPDYATQDDLDFLNDLAQKTLSFASLGVEQELAETTINSNLLDWVLYLDTNVLYSLLHLHSHPENESCEALLQLIKDNQQHIKIVLRYSVLTKKELNSKRNDFNLLDAKLTDSAIRALLKSDEVDDFSRKFYSNLLNNRTNTLHPSEIIDLSQPLLKKRDIEISRNQKTLEHIGENYLNTRIQDYRRFIDFKNEMRQNYNQENHANIRQIFRSDKQITHDITLREIILDQRVRVIKKSNLNASFNSVKYFAITLDEVLLDYDKQQLKEHEDNKSFPVFFKPSFLLNKLVKILPIKTNDYKKAFLKAVTARGFNKDVRKSHDILRLVNFLKSEGIDSETVVYDLISADLFMEKFRNDQNSPEFNPKEFVEAELNRKYKERERELNKAKIALEEKSNKAKDESEKNKVLSTKTLTLEQEMELYKSAITKLHKDVQKLLTKPQVSSKQVSINFEAEQQSKVSKELKRRLESQIMSDIDEYKLRRFKRWQNSIWWNLFWVIPFTISTIAIILFPTLLFKKEFDPDKIKYTFGIVTFILDAFFLKLIRDRYWDERNKESKRNSISITKRLQDRLNDIQNL